jgi:hypothetical protein
MIALAIGSTLNRTSFVAYAQLSDRHALNMLKGCFTDYTRSQAEKLEGGLLLARGLVWRAWCQLCDQTWSSLLDHLHLAERQAAVAATSGDGTQLGRRPGKPPVG